MLITIADVAVVVIVVVVVVVVADVAVAGMMLLVLVLLLLLPSTISTSMCLCHLQTISYCCSHILQNNKSYVNTLLTCGEGFITVAPNPYLFAYYNIFQQTLLLPKILGYYL